MGSGVEIHERKINHGCKSKHDYKTSSVDCNKSRLSWMPSMAIASSLLTIGSPLMTRITTKYNSANNLNTLELGARVYGRSRNSYLLSSNPWQTKS
jgi:hypothetical protein